MERRWTPVLLFLALACTSGGRRAVQPDAAIEGDTGGAGGGGGAVVAPGGRDGSVAVDVVVSALPDAATDAGPSPRDAAAERSVVPDAANIARDAANTAPDAAATGAFRMLVLSKTLEYHHDSIPACQQMLRELGATPDASLPPGARPGSQWTVTIANEDLSEFTDEGLRPYAMLFWCNPTGTVFTSGGAAGATGKLAVQKFLTSGGAWGGVHSATDFENTQGWPWFQDQVNGGNFASHDGDGTPDSVVWQPAAVALDHPVIRGIHSPWSCTDEWYMLNRDPGTLPGFVVLGKLARDQRPAVWVREIPGGGRSFYTIRGHNTAYYAEPSFRRLIHQGVLWATRRMK
jgi:hypothetical protein